MKHMVEEGAGLIASRRSDIYHLILILIILVFLIILVNRSQSNS